MEWYEIIISVLSGIIVTIPLVVKLVEYVKCAMHERNWNKLLTLVMKLMAEAENKFDNGVSRKEWVLAMVAASADVIDYPIDLDQIGALIDDLCQMSKKVNAPREVAK